MGLGQKPRVEGDVPRSDDLTAAVFHLNRTNERICFHERLADWEGWDDGKERESWEDFPISVAGSGNFEQRGGDVAMRTRCG